MEVQLLMDPFVHLLNDDSKLSLTEQSGKSWLAGLTAAKKIITQRWNPPHDISRTHWLRCFLDIVFGTITMWTTPCTKELMKNLAFLGMWEWYPRPGNWAWNLYPPARPVHHKSICLYLVGAHVCSTLFLLLVLLVFLVLVFFPFLGLIVFTTDMEQLLHLQHITRAWVEGEREGRSEGRQEGGRGERDNRNTQE